MMSTACAASRAITRHMSAAAAGVGSAQGVNVAAAQQALLNADLVAFDVDSTVLNGEGIDALAALAGKGEEVAAWTAKAMEGGVTFEESLAARLDIIKPDAALLAAFHESDPLELTPGVSEVVQALLRRGTAVYLVSGGFDAMIAPTAARLDLPASHVLANHIKLDAEGAFAGHDEEAFTARSGGKARAVAALKERTGATTVVMVGDGATDMEARPPADAFIGYGGIAVRPAVRAGADWFVTSWDPVLELLSEKQAGGTAPASAER